MSLFYCCQELYPYKYMDDQEKFNKPSLPEKEEFYSKLNIEDIADPDYAHAKNVCKDCEIKSLEVYHDLHVQSDIILLADVFENFRMMCVKIYINPARFPTAPGLACQVADTDMLLKVEKTHQRRNM